MMIDFLEKKNQLINLVEKYKSYEDLTIDSPPKISNYWSPTFGFIKLCENVTAYENSFLFPRKIILGIQIGTRFANGNLDIINQVRSETVTILKELVIKNKGFVLNQYGSAYYQIGYCNG